MTYTDPPNSKKNAISATLVNPILASDLTAVITDCSICYDVDGNLIKDGYVLRSPNSLTTPSPEELKISACSIPYGTGGQGTITFTRAANYDVNTGGTAQGAAYAWPAGTVISVMISIGVYNALVNAIKALKAMFGAWAAFSPTPVWGTADPTITTTVARYARTGNIVSFNVSFVISNGNAASSLVMALPVAAPQTANYQLPLIAFKKITTGGNSIMSDPFAYIDYTAATPVIKFNQFGTLPTGYTAVLNISGSYEVA